MRKAERHRLIESVIARKRAGTQQELLHALAAAGCTVTQATISRDIRELGLEKVRDPVGHPRFVPGHRAGRADPGEAVRSILARFGHRAVAAQNIVVLHAELGSAPAIGRALDELEHSLIVGTLAGDDTCLVIARTSSDAAALAGELTDFFS